MNENIVDPVSHVSNFHLPLHPCICSIGDLRVLVLLLNDTVLYSNIHIMGTGGGAV